MDSNCHGNCGAHCCIFKGVVCPHVLQTTSPRMWTCGLLDKYGNWDHVHRSREYRDDVEPLFETVPELEGMTCGGWPQDYPEVVIVQEDCGYFGR